MALFRKDLKVGFLVGAVVLVGGVGYLLFSGGNDKPAEDAGVDAMTAAPADTGSSASTGAPRQDPLAPLAGTNAGTNAGGGLGTPDNALSSARDVPNNPAGPAAAWNPGVFSSGVQVTQTPPQTAAAGGTNFQDTFGGVAADASPTNPAPTKRPAAPEQSAAPALAAGGATHTVEANENFSTIAQKYYGDGNLYLAIAKANPSIDPRRLKIGDKVVVPDKAAVETSKPAAAASAAKPAKADAATPADSGYTHVVSGNDTLYSIAEKRLGRAALWKDIYALNKAAIGDDPTKLPVGLTLRLPK